jgi:hypothetical protein
MIEKTTFEGLDAVRITNRKSDELIVLTGKGPRVISFRPEGGDNFFWVNEKDFSPAVTDDDGWHIFGGTRLWTSPETAQSYSPDNGPCEVVTENGTVTVTSPADTATKLSKILTVRADKESFSVTYTVRNEGAHLVTAGLWALSCVKPLENPAIYLPWGEPGQRPGAWDVKDIKYWRSWLGSETDIASRQWNPKNEFFIVKPTGEVGKVGTANRWGFAMYTWKGGSFIKLSDYIPTAHYPDDGCSFEIYTCERFYEIESLSPLFVMRPETSYSHTERWWAGRTPIDTSTVQGVYEFVQSILS